MKNIIIITGSELRHEYFRKLLALSASFKVIKTYCESEANTVKDVVLKDEHYPARLKHLAMREQTEKDFFQLFCTTTKDASHAEHIRKGDINLPVYVNEIIALAPDLIITYGCSIIKPALIAAFKEKIINIHLGLSPYYRGSGTNFWPFVNNEPEYAGVTFLYMDAGVDTGNIIHQSQAVIEYGDNIHQVGNRLIRDMAFICCDLVALPGSLPSYNTDTAITGKYYRNKDFTESAVEMMYCHFNEGLVDTYLEALRRGQRKVALITNPILDKQTVFA